MHSTDDKIDWIENSDGSFSVAPKDQLKMDNKIDDALKKAGLPSLDELRTQLKDGDDAGVYSD